MLSSQAVQYKSETDVNVSTFEESHGYFHKRAKYTSTMSVRHADRQTDRLHSTSNLFYGCSL